MVWMVQLNLHYHGWGIGIGFVDYFGVSFLETTCWVEKNPKSD